MKLLMKTTREEYIYDSEEEKLSHKIKMESKGFEDSGQNEMLNLYTLDNSSIKEV